MDLLAFQTFFVWFSDKYFTFKYVLDTQKS